MYIPMCLENRAHISILKLRGQLFFAQVRVSQQEPLFSKYYEKSHKVPKKCVGKRPLPLLSTNVGPVGQTRRRNFLSIDIGKKKQFLQSITKVLNLKSNLKQQKLQILKISDSSQKLNLFSAILDSISDGKIRNFKYSAV